MKNIGVVSDIQRFCIHDGPGIRTVIFFKGCLLRCLWCSNPETQSFKRELMYASERCIRCGTCVNICPSKALEIDRISPYIRINRDICTSCGNCSNSCPTASLVLKGEDMQVEELFEEIIKDRIVFEISGGGVTFSGGEPFHQPDFLFEILRFCKNAGLDTAVETTAYVPWNNINQCIPYVDHFLCDVKHTDDSLHSEWTKVSNKIILDNIEKLVAIHSDVLLRIPVVPGFNTDEKAAAGFSKYFLKIGANNVELLPYHILGEEKYAMLNKEYYLKNIKTEDSINCAKKLLEQLKKSGVKVYMT